MKNYKEVADAVFKRRDEYVAKQKKKRKTVITTLASLFCACIVLTIGFGMWQSGFLKDKIPHTEGLHNTPADNDNNTSKSNSKTRETDGTTTPPNTTTNLSHSTTAPSNSTTKRPEGEPTVSTTPSNSVTSKPSAGFSSQNVTTTSSVTKRGVVIDSIDKMNFYSVKKIISENALLPIGAGAKSFSALNTPLLSNGYYEYPIDRNKVFTTTLVIYFTIELNNENGFLAQKLGGTGLVEVVVTQNNIDDMGLMITFKREDVYYTCFANTVHHEPNTNKMTVDFSTHKYVEGFSIIKNLEQENYEFIVHCEGVEVVGLEVQASNNTSSQYAVDDITFIEDFCVVLFTRQTFTIDQLETYFKRED